MNEFDHGGNVYTAAQQAGCSVDEIIDLSSNISPFISDTLLNGVDIKKVLSRLPEPGNVSLIKDIAEHHDVPTDTITAGSGTTEFIEKICRIYSGQKALVLQPTYVDYVKYAKQNGMKVINIVMPEKTGFAFDDSDLIATLNDVSVCFICNPNNPTGMVISKDDIRFLADMFKKTLFVVDESYIDFCTDKNPTLIGCTLENIAVLRSFSKTYGIPGIRAGYLFTRDRNLTENLQSSISMWGLNSLAQELCAKALKTDISSDLAHIEDIKRETIIELSANENLKVYTGHTNFILIKLNKANANNFCEYMLSHKILVRNCVNFVGLTDRFIRISVKEKKHMDNFCRLAKVYFDIF